MLVDAALDGELVGDDPPWDPWTPQQVADRLAGTSSRWYVVAGWAIDLFQGRQTRAHEDIEIGVPAGDFSGIQSALPGFEFDVVGSGMRWPVDSAAFDEHFQTWVRDPATDVYHLDVFRDPHDGDTWLCRRDTSIAMPYSQLIRRTPDGIPFMSPEVVLLFKAKHDRDKDRADRDRVLPLLSPAQLRWLRTRLAQVHPGHEWLEVLK